MALIFIILLIIAICIPAGTVAGLTYIFGMDYYWYFWGIMMGLILIFNFWVTLMKPKSTIHNYGFKDIPSELLKT